MAAEVMDGNESTSSLRLLRRVIPIARSDVHDGLVVTLFGAEDYHDGFDLKCRLVALDGHPVRDLCAIRNKMGQARLRALKEEWRSGNTGNVAPLIFGSGELPTPPDALWPELLWVARDDLGNQYYATDQFSGSEFPLGEFRIELKFTPAIDQDAHEVWLEVSEIKWTTLPPRRETQSPVRIDPGPWVFSVDLTKGLAVVQTGDVD